MRRQFSSYCIDNSHYSITVLDRLLGSECQYWDHFRLYRVAQKSTPELHVSLNLIENPDNNVRFIIKLEFKSGIKILSYKNILCVI